MSLKVQSTRRFTVLVGADEVTAFPEKATRKGDNHPLNEPIAHARSCSLPVLSLEDLLLHERRQTTSEVQRALLSGLKSAGYVVLTTSSTSRPAKVIQNMKKSLVTQLFPHPIPCDSNDLNVNKKHNIADLKTSDLVYVSEKGVPMYKLGYELCEDHVREVFRIAAGDIDGAQVWPDNETDSHRNTWLQGAGLMRHITDTALDLLSAMSISSPRRNKRPHSGVGGWSKAPPTSPLSERRGDFSVLYAMHYFNENVDATLAPQPGSLSPKLPDEGVAVKAHVDPSLFVCEPFLCAETTGLQVLNRNNDADAMSPSDYRTCDWLDCDGPTSPFVGKLSPLEPHLNEIILLFVGKAIQSVIPDLEPTIHRVVTGHCARRTVIYEQKYEEFFPPPILD